MNAVAASMLSRGYEFLRAGDEARGFAQLRCGYWWELKTQKREREAFVYLWAGMSPYEQEPEKYDPELAYG